MHKTGRITVLAVLMLLMTAGAAALDINTSEDLRYFSGEEPRLWVDSDTAELTPFGNIDMSEGGEITDFFMQGVGGATGQCDTGEAIQYIQSDGTYSCIDLDQATGEGEGAANEVAFFQDAENITSDPQLYWNDTENFLGVDESIPGHTLDVGGDANIQGDLLGSGTTIWDSTAGHIPTGVLEAESVTINVGDHLTVTDEGEVSLGGSITMDVDGSTLDWSDLGIDQGDVNVGHLGLADANLDMNDLRIMNVVSEADGDAVNRSFVLDQVGDAEDGATQTLAEVLDEGNTADTFDIDMSNQALLNIGNLYSDGESTSFFSGGGSATETVTGIDADGTLQTTDILVTSNEIATDAVGVDELNHLNVVGDGLTGGDTAAIEVDPDTGIQVTGSGVSIDESVVAQLGEDETVSGAWTFNDDVTIQEDLIVMGNITNTEVEHLSVNGSLLPPEGFTDRFDIGEADRRWNDLHLAGNIELDGLVDGVDIDSPGTGIRVFGNAYEIASDAAGSGLSGGDGSALDVNVDGTTLEIVSDALQVRENGITGTELNNDAVGNEHISSGAVDTDEIATDAVTRTELNTTDVDNRYLRRDGTDPMTGDLDMGGNSISNVDCIGNEC